MEYIKVEKAEAMASIWLRSFNTDSSNAKSLTPIVQHLRNRKPETVSNVNRQSKHIETLPEVFRCLEVFSV